MITISILVLEDTFGSMVFPIIDLFENANDLMLETTGKKKFNMQLVGYKQKNPLINNYATVHCDKTIAEQPTQHILIVPAPHKHILQHMDLSYYDDLAVWLKSEHEKGTTIASFCLGAILLGHAGLLENQACTTHWMGVEAMLQHFPKACMEPEKTVVANDGIYTGGGAFSNMQLILFFIEEYCGREVALVLSKMAGIPYPIKSQSQFYMFNALKNHSDKAIIDVQNYMEKNYQKVLKTEELSKIANMSARNFIRRFKKATGDTPIEYLQKIRIETAKKAFESGETSVMETMYDVGYQDIKSFGSLFKRMTGMTPSSYAKRFKVK